VGGCVGAFAFAACENRRRASGKTTYDDVGFLGQCCCLNELTVSFV
jgi:hypothetical protein